MKRLQAVTKVPDLAGLVGVKVTDQYYDEVVTEDCDAYAPDGSLLFKFRKACLGQASSAVAFNILSKLNAKTLNRGDASGKGIKQRQVRKGGYLSNTLEVPSALAVNSSVLGYFDRYVRTPYCRQTAWTAEHPLDWARLQPFLRDAASVYEQEAGDRYKLQMETVAKTLPDWVIPGTPFTTMTANKDWQTACHTDRGDLKAGLGVLAALWAGKEEDTQGCRLVYPEFRIAVDLRTTDVLLFDSHHMHGNSPFLGRKGRYQRVSCVLYFRENMQRCLSPQAELERVKNRKKGDPLWEK